MVIDELPQINNYYIETRLVIDGSVIARAQRRVIIIDIDHDNEGDAFIL
jgi:hypothetical protein